MSPRLSPLAALLLAVAFGGCDTNEIDRYEPDTSLEVFVVDLEWDPDDYRPVGLSTASFFPDDVTVLSGDFDAALQTAGQGDLVMLYIDSRLVAQYETDQRTWTALPLTRGFNDVVFGDTDGDDESDGDLLVTSLNVSYEYSFEDGNVYFDVVSSLPYTEFSNDPDVLFRRVLPARFESTAPDDIRLRLVVIPDELFFTNEAARVNLRDYEAVQRAYGAPRLTGPPAGPPAARVASGPVASRRRSERPRARPAGRTRSSS